MREFTDPQKDQPWQKCFSFLFLVFSSWLDQELSRDFGIPPVGADFWEGTFVWISLKPPLKIRANKLKEVKELAEVARGHTRAKRRDKFGCSTCANRLSLES